MGRVHLYDLPIYNRFTYLNLLKRAYHRAQSCSTTFQTAFTGLESHLLTDVGITYEYSGRALHTLYKF